MNNYIDTEPKKISNQAAVRLLFQMIAVGIFVSLLLFISAGRLNWIQGWVFVTLWFVSKLSYVALVAKYDPELTAERANRHKNTQTYDRVLMTAYILSPSRSASDSRLRTTAATPSPRIMPSAFSSRG